MGKYKLRIIKIVGHIAFKSEYDMNEYQIKELTNDELSSFNQEAHKTIFFDDGQIFRFVKSLNEEETKKWKELSSYLGNPLRINLGMFKGEEFVGWSWGYQESALTFYMCNSAILPEHRKKGLYKKLGFVIEGVQKKDLKYGPNKYVDTILMGKIVATEMDIK